MSTEYKIEELLDSSKEVFDGCVLPNGAIIAANPAHRMYPNGAVNYDYVWGRDVAFTLRAAHELGAPPDITRNYAKWLLERAENFPETGIVIKRYGPNGALDRRYGNEYQPDQAGALIGALDAVTEDPDSTIEKVMGKLATGLSRQWRGEYFEHPTDHNGKIQDLWEDQTIQPGEQAVYTYTLASAIHGLERAIERLENAGYIRDEWVAKHTSMRALFNMVKSGGTHYPWKIPSSNANRQVDASLNALVWPFKNTAQTDSAEAPVSAIHNELYIPGEGVKRYDGDKYDGTIHGEDGKDTVAGTWPLLTFWHAIALNAVDREQDAILVYYEILNRINNAYIPEQLQTGNDPVKSPTPLAWSHSMFVLATKQLGLLD